jgi:hypothetical protein
MIIAFSRRTPKIPFQSKQFKQYTNVRKHNHSKHAFVQPSAEYHCAKPQQAGKIKAFNLFPSRFPVSFSSTFLISTLNLKPISQVQDNHVISCNGYIDEQRNHETVSTVYLRVLALASAR